MSELVRASVEERLLELRLGAVAQRLDGILSQAARAEPTYLDFLDQILSEETETKQRKRVATGIRIAHFPASLTNARGRRTRRVRVRQALLRVGPCAAPRSA